MSAQCIHGFDAGQCASCRACPHGLVATRCGACAAASATASRNAGRGNAPAPAGETRNGWEIFYAPEVTGWRVRSAESVALPDSYRSLFLARKAVDQLAAKAPAASDRKRRT